MLLVSKAGNCFSTITSYPKILVLVWKPRIFPPLPWPSWKLCDYPRLQSHRPPLCTGMATRRIIVVFSFGVRGGYGGGRACWSIGRDLPDQDPFQVRDCKSKFVTSLWQSFSLMNTIDQRRALSSQADPRTPFACPTWPLLPASMGSLIRHLIPLRSPVRPPLPTYILVSDWYVIPVPIFDGRGSPSRPAFSFSDADFEKLPSWPKWMGEGELPNDSLVVVGYTWTTYMNASQVMSFSSNLLFVILLGLGTGTST